MNRFQQELERCAAVLRRGRLETLQLNLGRICNQACRHCHVDAGPWRTETIDANTATRIGQWIEDFRPPIVDLTGGAPELSEWFPFLVQTARAAGGRVIDRCNLTIIEERGFAWLPEWLAARGVEIIASLPCYLADNVAKQRGAGVFERSVRALHKLNAVGYGTHLRLDLVYNPLGPTLPGAQHELEAAYKHALQHEHGITFHRLLTLTNQPIARFADDLRARGELESYLDLLEANFNPDTIPGLMCRNTLSVGYRGELYDCDFNQMLGLRLRSEAPLFLWDIDPARLEHDRIQTGAHCLACTAGCGSSCTGALTMPRTVPARNPLGTEPHSSHHAS